MEQVIGQDSVRNLETHAWFELINNISKKRKMQKAELNALFQRCQLSCLKNVKYNDVLKCQTDCDYNFLEIVNNKKQLRVAIEHPITRLSMIPSLETHPDFISE